MSDHTKATPRPWKVERTREPAHQTLGGDMRVTLHQHWGHKLLGVARLEIDGKRVGWWPPKEAMYLRDTLNGCPWSLSIFLASRTAE